MKCDRCDNVSVDHVAIREGAKVSELHLCQACANADAGITEIRQRAKQNTALPQPANVHHFIQQWQSRCRLWGRELSKDELIQLLDRLCD